MQNITIGRLEGDLEAQGVIKPADGRWQLVLDKDGFPHLYVQCNTKDDDGTPIKGMFLVEDLLPDNMTIRDLMEGSFEGRVSPEEEKAAFEEYMAHKAKHGLPCPR